VKSHQGFGFATDTFCNIFSQSPPDGYIALITRIPVTADYPDDVPGILVPVAEIAAVGTGIVHVEYFRSRSPGIPEYFNSPGRQHTDVNTRLGSFVHYPVHVFEVCLVWPGRIVVLQGYVAVRVGRTQAIKFGQHYRLNDREALLHPPLQIAFGIFAV
jgi:hypothetical protein